MIVHSTLLFQRPHVCHVALGFRSHHYLIGWLSITKQGANAAGETRANRSADIGVYHSLTLKIMPPWRDPPFWSHSRNEPCWLPCKSSRAISMHANALHDLLRGPYPFHFGVCSNKPRRLTYLAIAYVNILIRHQLSGNSAFSRNS